MYFDKGNGLSTGEENYSVIMRVYFIVTDGYNSIRSVSLTRRLNRN